MNNTHNLQLGMPTLIALPDLQANVDLCRQLGLGFVELNMDLPAYQPKSLPVEEIIDIRRRYGVDFTLHMPERLDVGCFHEDVREGYIACALAIIDWAGKAGISKINMHMSRGVYFTLPEGKVWLYEKHRELYLANLRSSMDKMMAAAQRANMTVLIENTGNFSLCFMQEAIEDLLVRYKGRVGLTWDTGHDAEVGYSDSPFIRRHVDSLRHMHLHDFDGKSAHQPLLTGSVDVPAFLNLARQRSVSVVLETKTPAALTTSVQNLRSARLI
ncbi:MAG: TIM barrel protein [Phycisphaerae bacterium]|jgi:sugar phosphate isomerase/epimerase